MSDTVTLEQTDRVATVTVDNQAERNVLDLPTREELCRAVETADEDDSIRAIVLRGAGTDHYLDGADLREFLEYELLEGMEYVRDHGQGTYNFVADRRTPTLAAIDGHAFGGALELSLACDIRVASTEAVLGLTEVNFGLIPGGGGIPRLVQVVGTGVASELVLRGQTLDAQEARDVNLVTHVFEPAEFEEGVLDIATDLASKPPIAVELAKDAIQRTADIESALEFERLACSLTFGTDDKREGIEAFFEDRDPEFTGS